MSAAVAVLSSTASDLRREAPDIETSSEAYVKRFAGPVGAWFLRVQEQAVLHLLSMYPAATILEVGGGHGQLTGALVSCGYGVTVFGSDKRCMQRIRGLVESRRCRFVTGDLLHLPYTDRAFDVVISLRLLPHMEAWPALIGELSRVARRAVIVDYPTVRSLNCLSPMLFPAKRLAEGDTRFYRNFHDSEVAGEFGRRGFISRQRLPQFFWPMVLHRVLGRPGVSAGLERVARIAQLIRWFGSPVIASFTRGAAA